MTFFTKVFGPAVRHLGSIGRVPRHLETGAIPRVRNVFGQQTAPPLLVQQFSAANTGMDTFQGSVNTYAVTEPGPYRKLEKAYKKLLLGGKHISYRQDVGIVTEKEFCENFKTSDFFATAKLALLAQISENIEDYMDVTLESGMHGLRGLRGRTQVVCSVWIRKNTPELEQE